MSQHSNEAVTGKGYLPREKGALIVPFDDSPGLIDQAQEILGERMTETRQGYRLDGKPCNTGKLLAAAGLKCKDEQ